MSRDDNPTPKCHECGKFCVSEQKVTVFGGNISINSLPENVFVFCKKCWNGKVKKT